MCTQKSSSERLKLEPHGCYPSRVRQEPNLGRPTSKLTLHPSCLVFKVTGHGAYNCLLWRKGLWVGGLVTDFILRPHFCAFRFVFPVYAASSIIL